MKVDMKEQMTMMMEAMMSMRKMMEVNAAIVVVASTATERDLIHPFGFNQESRSVSDVVGQGGEATTNAYGPDYVQVQSKSSFPPYGLPPNYTPPTVVYAPGENIGSFAPVFIENQQPQPDHTHAHVSQPMGETHKAPQDHTLISFGVYLGYTTEGHAFSGVPMPNVAVLSIDHHHNLYIL